MRWSEFKKEIEEKDRSLWWIIWQFFWRFFIIVIILNFVLTIIFGFIFYPTYLTIMNKFIKSFKDSNIPYNQIPIHK